MSIDGIEKKYKEFKEKKAELTKLVEDFQTKHNAEYQQYVNGRRNTPTEDIEYYSERIKPHKYEANTAKITLRKARGALMLAKQDADFILGVLVSPKSRLSPAIRDVIMKNRGNIRANIYYTMAGFHLRRYCGENAAKHYYRKGSHQATLATQGSDLWKDKSIREFMTRHKNLQEAIVSRKPGYNFDPNKQDAHSRSLGDILNSVHLSKRPLSQKQLQHLSRDAGVQIGLAFVIAYLIFAIKNAKVAENNNHSTQNPIKTAETPKQKSDKKTLGIA